MFPNSFPKTRMLLAGPRRENGLTPMCVMRPHILVVQELVVFEFNIARSAVNANTLIEDEIYFLRREILECKTLNPDIGNIIDDEERNSVSDGS